MKKKITDPDELLLKNLLLKSELENNFGMQRISTDDIPPEIENAFLKHILNFESAHRNAKKVCLWEFIGSPSFLPYDEAHPDEIPTLLHAITIIMERYNVSLEMIHNYPDDLIYRFITEELFAYEVADVHTIAKLCFIYEEFHPNHEYDLKVLARKVLDDMFGNKMLNNGDLRYSNSINLNGEVLSYEDYRKLIHTFHQKIIDHSLKEIEIIKLEIDPEETNAFVELQFEYATISGNESQSVKCGTALLEFSYEYEVWEVSKITTGGINLSEV